MMDVYESVSEPFAIGQLRLIDRAVGYGMAWTYTLRILQEQQVWEKRYQINTLGEPYLSLARLENLRRLAFESHARWQRQQGVAV